MKILVIAEHANDQLRPVTANAVAAASALGAKAGGAEITVLVAGQSARPAAEAAAALAGVNKVLLAEAAHLAEQVAEPIAEQVLAVCGAMDAIIFPATAFGKNAAPVWQHGLMCRRSLM